MKVWIILLLAFLLVAPVYAADITITIPDGQVSRVVNAFALVFKYRVEICSEEGCIANPQTKNQFAKEKMAQLIKDIVKSAEAAVAQQQARDNALVDVENNLSITAQ